MEQALLTIWNDLLREGHLAWGHNLMNPDPPFCHLTTKGREVLRNLSRDPANPDGYIAHLMREVKLNPVTESYIREALHAYNSNCYKAAAVMVGCASESLLLELRDELVARMTSLSLTIPKKLKDWRIRTFTVAIHGELTKRVSQMDRHLRESFESYWTAFTHQIRVIRNDAGHPLSVEPVSPESVHGSLLVFPELAALNHELRLWVQKSFE